MLVWKRLKSDINTVFILKTVFENFKLKDTNNAHDNLFHSCIELLENLNRTFLCNLVDTLNELFSLHSINLSYSCKMFWCKCRYTLKCKFLVRFADSITDREYSRIKYTDNISCICLINNMPLLRHHLLRLAESNLLATLYMVSFHSGFKLTGTYSHKSNSVSVCFIHISLNLEYKC